jgi:dUTP pyrophosphatase
MASKMHLKIFVDSEDTELKEMYVKAAEKHNQKNNIDVNPYPDAGFDLYVPTNLNDLTDSIKIDYKIKCSAVMESQGTSFPTGYYIYPRSSISNTALRLANCVGIIDSGYRGNLICAFDVKKSYCVDKFTRLTQLCSPNLCPISVSIVDTLDDLGDKTIRGEGGFGSTGSK